MSALSVSRTADGAALRSASKASPSAPLPAERYTSSRWSESAALSAAFGQKRRHRHERAHPAANARTHTAGGNDLRLCAPQHEPFQYGRQAREQRHPQKRQQPPYAEYARHRRSRSPRKRPLEPCQHAPAHEPFLFPQQPPKRPIFRRGALHELLRRRRLRNAPLFCKMRKPFAVRRFGPIVRHTKARIRKANAFGIA